MISSGQSQTDHALQAPDKAKALQTIGEFAIALIREGNSALRTDLLNLFSEVVKKTTPSDRELEEIHAAVKVLADLKIDRWGRSLFLPVDSHSEKGRKRRWILPSKLFCQSFQPEFR